MIVFEGINKTGKTTIAEKLSGVVKFPIVRVVNVSQNKGLAPLVKSIEQLGSPTNDFYEDMVIMEFINQTGFKSVILDRSLPSSVAYRFYKNRKVISSDILNWWFTSLKANNGLYVWVDSSWEQVHSRGLKQGWMENHGEYLDLHRVFFTLYELAKNMKVNCVKIYNESGTKIEDCVDQIMNQLVKK